jgi:hypothetical protein
MADIFICYRRADSGASAETLKTKLCDEFERSSDKGTLVYLDVRDPRPGEKWPDNIKDALTASHVVLVVIGPDWAKPSADGTKRLEREDDWVRQEIELAIKGKKTAIPVLVDNAKLPNEDELPEGPIRRLLKHNAETVRTGRDDAHEKLIEEIFRALPPTARARKNAEFRNPDYPRLIVCRYDLTGIAEATESREQKDDWQRKYEGFGVVAPHLMQEARAFVERKLLEARSSVDPDAFRAKGGFDWQPTSDGAIFFVDEGHRFADLFNATIQKAREATREFAEEVIANFARHDSRGLNWIVDIRIAIADGRIAATKGRDANTARRSTRYFGSPLSRVSLLLGYRDPKGRPLVRRGDVAVVGENKPDGFHEYGKIPSQWPLEGTDLSMDFKEAFDKDAKIWLARREPITAQHFRIRGPAVSTLKRRTLTTDEKAKDLLNHVPPANYPEIAKLAKTGERFCIIVGEPGAGKTLCGLRLVAELMYIDGFDVSVPPVTGGTWERLAKQSNPDLVILLDDAFGKTKVITEADLTDALEALDNSPPDVVGGPDETADDKEERQRSFLRQPPGNRPALIVTVRRRIWDDACRRLHGWGQKLSKYMIEIKQESYRPEDRIQLFKNYWRDDDGNSLPITQKLESEVATISHPLSIRDFARECADAKIGPSGAIARISTYRRDALERYLYQLGNSNNQLTDLWHFLTWAFGGTLLEKKEVKELYELLGVALGFTRVQTSIAWAAEDDPPHWGKWEDNGYFTASHPLREEAVDRFFRNPDRKRVDLIDGFFQAFWKLHLVDKTDDSLKRAAFAAPRVSGPIGPFREKVIQTAAGDPNSDAARVLASSIGQTFRNTFADQTAWDSTTRSVLVDALKSMLASPNNAAFGVAFAALCDSFQSYDEIPTHLVAIERLALDRLASAASLTEEKRHAIPSEQKIRTQNIDHSMWAIASNFPRVPDDFRELFACFVERGRDDWLRLRAVEAAADYIDPIKDATAGQAEAEKGEERTAHNFEKYIEAAAGDRDQPDFMRRGVAGAVEANFDSLVEFAKVSITDWLDSPEERYNYGFLEWVIWAAGEHLAGFKTKTKTDSEIDIEKNFADALLKLARHEDSRVRKWLATALAESDVTNESNFLRSVLTRLARDDDDTVRDVALDFFLEESEEESDED